MCACYIQRFSRSRPHLNEVKELVDSIIVSIFQVNIKVPTKLVTNSEPFLASLEVLTLASNYEPLSVLAYAELKKYLKTVILSEKTFTNKQEFFSKISSMEADLLFSSLIQIT